MTSHTPPHVQATTDMFTDVMHRAREAGVPLRAPPPLPTTCCGRGCNGCVWEGFYAAANYWQEEALLKLAAARPALAR